MGWFGNSDKDKRKFTRTHIPEKTVSDLKLGDQFDFDGKTWKVKEEYEYDWGNECFTSEFKITSGSIESFLYMEENDDGLEIILSRNLPLAELDTDLGTKIDLTGSPDESYEYEGETYHFDEESSGYYRNVSTTSPEESEEFISWSYYDESEKLVLIVEQWGDEEFEASIGKVVSADQFKNIKPKPGIR
ncbi:DUF4178 domain-containing protein [bacterium SCSIO 12741]|nr:DUF4178 domain-containing protein [bacterium SCSIO 12741]